jgi:hypothetical protein
VFSTIARKVCKKESTQYFVFHHRSPHTDLGESRSHSVTSWALSVPLTQQLCLLIVPHTKGERIQLFNASCMRLNNDFELSERTGRFTKLNQLEHNLMLTEMYFILSYCVLRPDIPCSLKHFQESGRHNCFKNFLFFSSNQGFTLQK